VPPDRRAYALIVDAGKALLVKNRSGNWTLPGGRAKRGEKLREAAVREVREETGVEVKLGRRLPPKHVRRHERECRRCVIFLARVGKGKPTPTAEIDKVKWVSLTDVADRMPNYRPKRVRQAIDDLSKKERKRRGA
jgi:ADP-ribose pyrophosphatase YjhB (NUDIX family)